MHNLDSPNIDNSFSKYISYVVNAPVGICNVSLTGEIVYSNPFFQDFIGYNELEIAGLNFRDITDPTDLDSDLLELEKLLNGQQNNYTIEKRYVHKSGKIVNGQLHVSCLKDQNNQNSSLVGMVIDLTNYHANKKALEEQAKSFKNMFLNNPQVMVIYDANDFSILEVNETASSILGYSAKELKRMQICELLSPESHQKFEKFARKIATDKLLHENWCFMAKSGQKLLLNINSHPIQFQGRRARHIMAVDVTESERIKQDLIEREQSIRHAQEIANMGSWEYDLVSRKTLWSENLYRLFNLTPGECTPSYDYFLSIIHPEDRHIVEQARKKSVSTKDPISFEFRILLPNQKIKWLQNNVESVWENDKVIKLRGINIDITKRKEYEIQIEYRNKVERFINDIISSYINSFVSEIDVVINSSFRKIGQFLGLDKIYLYQIDKQERFVSRLFSWCRDGIGEYANDQSLVPIDKNSWWMNQMYENKLIQINDLAELPPEANLEKEFITKQGVRALLTIPMFFQQQLIGFIGFSNIKNSKKWQDFEVNMLKSLSSVVASEVTRRDVQNELVRAKEKAEESDKLKSTFLALISHELRTPLNPILGFSQLITNFSEDPKITEFAQTIYKSGNELLTIIEDLFELSFVKNFKLKAKTRAINCADFYIIAKSTLEDILSHTEKDANIKLIFNDQYVDMHKSIVVDYLKVFQVVSILFKNAVKFTDQGEIEFGFSLNQEKNKLNVWVKDTGIGFDVAQREQIFEVFRQMDDSRTRRHGGLGIGLPIAKTIVDFLDGSINLHSKVGEGSIVDVEIPVSIKPTGNCTRKTDVGEKSHLKGKSILVVDDDQIIHQIVSHLVSEFEMEVFHANSGAEAIEFLAMNKPDVVLLDMIMPEMDGRDVLPKIKSMHPNLPVTALTAHYFNNEKKNFINFGFNDLLTKPIYPELFFEVLKNNLSSI